MKRRRDLFVEEVCLKELHLFVVEPNYMNQTSATNLRGRVSLSFAARGWWNLYFVSNALVLVWRFSKSVGAYFNIPKLKVSTGVAYVLTAVIVFFPFNFVLSMLSVRCKYSSPSFCFICVCLILLRLHVAQVSIYLYIVLVHGFHSVVILCCEVSHFQFPLCNTWKFCIFQSQTPF